MSPNQHGNHAFTTPAISLLSVSFLIFIGEPILMNPSRRDFTHNQSQHIQITSCQQLTPNSLLVLNTLFNTHEPSVSAASDHFISPSPKPLIFFVVKIFSLQIKIHQLYYFILMGAAMIHRSPSFYYSIYRTQGFCLTIQKTLPQKFARKWVTYWYNCSKSNLQEHQDCKDHS